MDHLSHGPSGHICCIIERGVHEPLRFLSSLSCVSTLAAPTCTLLARKAGLQPDVVLGAFLLFGSNGDSQM